MWVLPLAALTPDVVRVTPRVDWEDPEERVWPASAVLRSLPWGRVVRIPGFRPYEAKVRGTEALVSVPREAMAFALPEPTQPWAYSFSDPQAAAETIRGLVDAEQRRVGPQPRD